MLSQWRCTSTAGGFLHLPTRAELEAALGQRDWIEHPALPGRTNHRRAGVLVPVVWEASTLHTLLTLRPAVLRRHGGEISFPGGRPEPGDGGLEGTARREAREELGLARVDVIGRLSSMPVYTSNFRLEPFVATVDVAELEPDPVEVERVLRVDLMAELARDHLESVAGFDHGHHWELPVFRSEGLVVFGATALTLAELLQVVAGVVGVPVPPLRQGPLVPADLFARGAAAGLTG